MDRTLAHKRHQEICGLLTKALQRQACRQVRQQPRLDKEPLSCLYVPPLHDKREAL